MPMTFSGQKIIDRIRINALCVYNCMYMYSEATNGVSNFRKVVVLTLPAYLLVPMNTLEIANTEAV